MRNLAITFTSLQAVSRLKWECEEFSNNVYKFTGGVQVKVGM